MGHVAVAAGAVMAATLWFLLLIVPLLASVVEDSVEFQDGEGNVVQALTPGDLAAFYVRDGDLATLGTCTATWSAATSSVVAGTAWSLATGSPRSTVFGLSEGCSFDTGAPASTPLTTPPAERLPWVASVLGVPNFVADFSAASGEIELLNDVDSGSAVVIDFYFHAVDRYAASDHRARVQSSSDPQGEWSAITEVVSETDAGASATSGLLRGQVELSGRTTSTRQRDGAVWARGGDLLTVTYYLPDGVSVVDSHSVGVAAGPISSVPVTGLGGLALTASLLVLVVFWRLRRREAAHSRDGA